VAPRFRATETNATKLPTSPTTGSELAPLPGVTPSAEETKYVVGMHVGAIVSGVTPSQILRTYTCGVMPSAVVTPVTRFVASDTNATYCPSGLSEGL